MNLVNRDIIEQQYDRYVDYYNESRNPISTYAELLTIKEGLQKRLDELEEKVELYVQDIKYYLGEVFNSSTQSSEEDLADELLLRNHEDLIENIVGHIKWDIDSFNHIFHASEFLSFNSNQIGEAYKAYNKNGQEQKSLRALRSIIWYGDQYERVYYHLKGIKSVTNRIIDDDYPTPLRDYRNLTEEERKELFEDKNLGAPQKKEAPQEKIKETVAECIKDKSSKRFIHQSGRYKGKANQNQIYIYIRSKFPEMAKGSGKNPEKGLSKRHFIRRIKKALPDDMT